jgi:hypothetical protein
VLHEGKHGHGAEDVEELIDLRGVGEGRQCPEAREGLPRPDRHGADVGGEHVGRRRLAGFTRPSE